MVIKVLIVDDSATARVALREALQVDPEIMVAGEADTGASALHLVKRLDPDLVTMDVYLTEENGLDVTKEIMTIAPRPILVVTGVNPADSRLIYRAMEMGALEVVGKLPVSTHPDFRRRRAQLVSLAKALAGVPILHRSRHQPRPFAAAREAMPPRPASRGRTAAAPKLIVIGASTGGPPLVRALLKAIDKPSRVPIVVVQHMSTGFAAGFAEWLLQVSGHPCQCVLKDTAIRPGSVFVAPDDCNLELSAAHFLRRVPPESGQTLNPSIDTFLVSAARHFGSSVLAILLSGMGADGAQGLKAVANAGGSVIVQTPETCAVDSMPRAALALGFHTSSMSPEDIGAYLASRLASPP